MPDHDPDLVETIAAVAYVHSFSAKPFLVISHDSLIGFPITNRLL